MWNGYLHRTGHVMSLLTVPLCRRYSMLVWRENRRTSCASHWSGPCCTGWTGTDRIRQLAAHTGTHWPHWSYWNNTDLIVLSVLDAAQSCHPLLHLLPVVCTQNKTSAGGDHLYTQTHTHTHTQVKTLVSLQLVKEVELQPYLTKASESIQNRKLTITHLKSLFCVSLTQTGKRYSQLCLL